MKKNRFNLKWIFSLLVILLFTSCDTQSKKDVRAWEVAKTKNSITSFKEYLKIYPDGRFADDAKRNFDSILWVNTLDSNKYELYKLYQSSSYFKPFAQQADSLAQILLWNTAVAENSYELYLKEFPNGKYSKQAKHIYEKYLIQDGKVSDFIILKDRKENPISEYKEFLIKKEEGYYSESFETFFPVFENGKQIMTVRPFSLEIYSSKFHTEKKIGINSTIEEFIKAYPVNKISSMSQVGNSILTIEINEINGYFTLDDNDYLGDVFNIASDEVLKPTDFKKGSKIKEITIYPHDSSREKIGNTKPVRSSNTQSTSNSISSTSLPTWLQRTNWVLNNQYGVVIAVKFIDNNYLMFRLLDESFQMCKYSIPSNLNCIYFKCNNQNFELWFYNNSHTLETKTGQSLSQF